MDSKAGLGLLCVWILFAAFDVCVSGPDGKYSLSRISSIVESLKNAGQIFFLSSFRWIISAESKVNQPISISKPNGQIVIIDNDLAVDIYAKQSTDPRNTLYWHTFTSHQINIYLPTKNKPFRRCTQNLSIRDIVITLHQRQMISFDCHRFVAQQTDCLRTDQWWPPARSMQIRWFVRIGTDEFRWFFARRIRSSSTCPLWKWRWFSWSEFSWFASQKRCSSQWRGA